MKPFQVFHQKFKISQLAANFGKIVNDVEDPDLHKYIYKELRWFWIDLEIYLRKLNLAPPPLAVMVVWIVGEFGGWGDYYFAFSLLFYFSKMNRCPLLDEPCPKESCIGCLRLRNQISSNVISDYIWSWHYESQNPTCVLYTCLIPVSS